MRRSLRKLLAQGKPLVTPGAHDVLSARLIEQAGFQAIAIGGLALLVAQRGLPDIGLAALTDMVESARPIVESTELPCGIDGDDGYGDVKSVARTVIAYERLGVASIIFEDQDLRAKRPGEGRTTSVVPADEMLRKLRAALAARRDPDTLILARTDAFRVEGLDAALRRADAYLQAGADGIFVAGLDTPEQLRSVGERFRGAIQVATVTERLLPVMPGPAALYELGFSQIVYPQFVTTRMVAAAEAALGELAALAAGRRLPGGIVPDLAHSEQLQALARLRDWLAIEGGAQ